MKSRTIVTLILVLMSILTSARSSRQFFDDLLSNESAPILTLQPEGYFGADVQAVTVEVRAALKGGRGEWGIQAGNYRILLGFESTPLSDLSGGDQPVIKIIDTRSGDVISSFKGSPRGWAVKDENSLIVGIHSSGAVTIDGGHRIPEQIGDISIDDIAAGSLSVVAIGGVFKSITAVVETEDNILQKLSTSWTEQSLTDYLAESNDPMESLWVYLDGNTNPDMAVAGGRYKLASVANDDGGYNLIYVAGATVNPDSWHSGMVKATLIPTIFDNHYNVIWHDSRAESITFDVSADIEQGAILSVSFPRYQATLRFSRVIH